MRTSTLPLRVLAAIALVAGCTNASTTSGPPSAGTPSSAPSTTPSAGTPSSAPSTTPTPRGDAPTSTAWGPTGGQWRRALDVVAGMSDRELAGQVIMARYDGTRAPTELVDRFHLGGVIVMTENVESIDAILESNRKLASATELPWPPAVGVDQEGGLVARLGQPMTQFPTYMSLGAGGDSRLATRVARASGDELRAAGFTMVFAPDADVTIGPADPTIGSRSAGDRPAAVADIVAASTRGYLQSGIVPVVKHFPGHGSVTANSHETLPRQSSTLAELRRRDFVPFAAAIDGGAPAVMVGHLSLERVDPGVPADLSRADIALLRSELGFRGLVVSDALEMAAVTDHYGSGEAAVAALKAGVDLLLMPLDTAGAYRGIVEALQDGTLSRSRVEEAAAKLGALMLHEHRVGPADVSSIGSHRALSYRESVAAVTVVEGACRGPYVAGAVDPVGEPAYVSAFGTAAEAAGLQLGAGTTVGLMGSQALAQQVDIAVSVTTPYGLADADGAATRLALYGWSPEAMRALVAVLTGAAAPRGTLPVRVEGTSPPRCG